MAAGPDELPEVERLTTAFRRDHRSDDPAADLRALLFALDHQEALPAFQRLRDFALERLAPAPGETAVDVGAGTGAVARALAARVGPTGRAVGVEPHAGLRQVAVERSAEVDPAPELVDGDAYALPFEDGSVHVLHCERVWQHLHEPDRAAAEVARVLAPGGRAAVLDTDWGTMIAEPGDPDLLRRVNEVSWEASPNPFSGRRLSGLLRRAGLEVDPDVGASAFVMPGGMVEQGMVGLALRRAVTAGRVGQGEADTWVASMADAAREGTAFLAVTMFAVVARRPG